MKIFFVGKRFYYLVRQWCCRRRLFCLEMMQLRLYPDLLRRDVRVQSQIRRYRLVRCSDQVSMDNALHERVVIEQIVGDVVAHILDEHGALLGVA